MPSSHSTTKPACHRTVNMNNWVGNFVNENQHIRHCQDNAACSSDFTVFKLSQVVGSSTGVRKYMVKNADEL